jgi:hypothetical protein
MTMNGIQMKRKTKKMKRQKHIVATVVVIQKKHEIFLTRHTLTTHRSRNKRKMPIETVVPAPSKKKKADGNQNVNLNCDVCAAKFTRKDNLKRHKMRKH